MKEHVKDIVDSIILPDANEKVLNFATVDLNRLRHWNPNETDNFVVTEKFALSRLRMT